ncbi:MAG: MarR family transcriptional regulator [Alphaproteobacteria bacterium]
MSNTKNLSAVTQEIRSAFHLLKTLGDALHADTGVTTSMRGVLETLVVNGPQTVPQVAAAKSVSRQHIQQLVDPLVAAGLAALQDNPGHKRSPIVTATRRGNDLFESMQRKEAVLFQKLARDHNAGDLKATLSTLSVLNKNLALIAKELTDVSS